MKTVSATKRGEIVGYLKIIQYNFERKKIAINQISTIVGHPTLWNNGKEIPSILKKRKKYQGRIATQHLVSLIQYVLGNARFVLFLNKYQGLQQ